VLDEGFSPPERQPASHDRTTREEQRLGETIDDRLAQEEPDTLAGDLATPPLGDPNQDRAGRLVAPDEGAREDVEKDAVADDVGIDGGAASAEEAAVHIVRDDDRA
jgi:hypothetical protein